MVFSSLYFLFLYLPIVLFVYYITPLKWRNAVLLVFNLIFYGWGEPVYIVIMFVSIAIDYTHGILVERCKRRGNDRGAKLAVASSVVFNLALLFFFKYWDFVAGSLAAIGLDFMPKFGLSLPIGISFYTFQTMSYTIDVYRGDAGVQRNIVNFGTFVTLFPQLIAGPIIKYKDLEEQIGHRTHSVEQFASGVQVFVVGMGKKLLLANNLGMLWDAYQAVPTAELTVLGAWLGVVAFSFQIYFDFSGYSDMAIGLGRMLGFEFLKNFDYPYISKSITEFWRRWHISLSTWFRDYLYIPLGGNRCSTWKHVRNILMVWTLTGLWHGAAWNFLCWGLYFGLLLLGEKYGWGKQLGRAPAVAQHLYTMLLVVVSWVVFRAETLGYAGHFLGAMAGFAQSGWSDERTTYYLLQFRWELLLAIPAAMPVKQWLQTWLEARRGTTWSQVLLLWGPKLLALGLFGLAFLRLVSSSFNPFIYFRF